MTARYVLRRVVHALVILVLASAVVFALLHLAPGDPARLMLGEQASATDVAALRHQLGLDRPLWRQYASFLADLAQGDLGTSIRAQRPVAGLVAEALPDTLLLVAAALLVALVIGMPIGVLAGFRRGRPLDGLAQVVALLGQAVPSFWLGMMLISVVALRWGLLPTSGIGGIEHLVLPALALAPFLVGLVIRVTRQSVTEVLHEDYIRTAHAKGLAATAVVYPHTLKNALIPVTTVVALYAAGMVGGAVVVEVVFAWPGVGQLAVNALVQRDYPVVQGVVLVSALVFIVVNLLVDMAYLALDPRARYE